MAKLPEGYGKGKLNKKWGGESAPVPVKREVPEKLEEKSKFEKAPDMVRQPEEPTAPLFYSEEEIKEKTNEVIDSLDREIGKAVDSVKSSVKSTGKKIFSGAKSVKDKTNDKYAKAKERRKTKKEEKKIVKEQKLTEDGQSQQKAGKNARTLKNKWVICGISVFVVLIGVVAFLAVGYFGSEKGKISPDTGATQSPSSKHSDEYSEGSTEPEETEGLESDKTQIFNIDDYLGIWVCGNSYPYTWTDAAGHEYHEIKYDYQLDFRQRVENSLYIDIYHYDEKIGYQQSLFGGGTTMRLVSENQAMVDIYSYSGDTYATLNIEFIDQMVSVTFEGDSSFFGIKDTSLVFENHLKQGLVGRGDEIEDNPETYSETEPPQGIMFEDSSKTTAKPNTNSTDTVSRPPSVSNASLQNPTTPEPEQEPEPELKQETDYMNVPACRGYGDVNGSNFSMYLEEYTKTTATVRIGCWDEHKQNQSCSGSICVINRDGLRLWGDVNGPLGQKDIEVTYIDITFRPREPEPGETPEVWIEFHNECGGYQEYGIPSFIFDGTITCGDGSILHVEGCVAAARGG